MNREPVAIVKVVEALLLCLLAFGLDLDKEQIAALIVLASTVSTLVMRGSVSPVHPNRRSPASR